MPVRGLASQGGRAGDATESRPGSERGRRRAEFKVRTKRSESNTFAVGHEVRDRRCGRRSLPPSAFSPPHSSLRTPDSSDCHPRNRPHPARAVRSGHLSPLPPAPSQSPRAPPPHATHPGSATTSPSTSIPPDARHRAPAGPPLGRAVPVGEAGRAEDQPSPTCPVSGISRRLRQSRRPDLRPGRSGFRLTADAVVGVERQARPRRRPGRRAAPRLRPASADGRSGFLLASRYCEVDRLGSVAWGLFGATPLELAPGAGRRATGSTSHLTFGMEHARPTRTRPLRRIDEEPKGVLPRLRPPVRLPSVAA